MVHGATEKVVAATMKLGFQDKLVAVLFLAQARLVVWPGHSLSILSA